MRGQVFEHVWSLRGCGALGWRAWRRKREGFSGAARLDVLIPRRDTCHVLQKPQGAQTLPLPRQLGLVVCDQHPEEAWQYK